MIKAMINERNKMKFLEAVELLKSEKLQIRRKCWSNRHFRLLRNGDKFSSMGGSKNLDEYTLKIEDVSADDWEIFEGQNIQSAIRTSNGQSICRMLKPQLVLTKDDYTANDWAVCGRK